jgi:hypothetical protein
VTCSDKGPGARRDRPGLHLPYDDAFVSFAGAILLEQNDEWTRPARPLRDTESIASLSDNRAVSLQAIAS